MSKIAPKESSWMNSLKIEECEVCSMGIMEAKKNNIDVSRGRNASVIKCIERIKKEEGKIKIEEAKFKIEEKIELEKVKFKIEEKIESEEDKFEIKGKREIKEIKMEEKI